MTRHSGSAQASALLIAALVGCQVKPPALVPGARAVEVANAAPPQGATNLGPIAVADGDGCGLRGIKGSQEGAEVELRNEAERRGGDYVQVTRSITPHVEGGCYDVRFVMRGVVFRVRGPVLADARAPREQCVPACSPGYECIEGTCRAECNPGCAPDQTCGQDRTCRAGVTTGH